MRTYPYRPQPITVDRSLVSAIQVYQYLIFNASERARMIDEICRLQPNEPFIVRITHRSLPGHLTYSTVESDQDFLRRIEGLLQYELGQCYLITSVPSVRPYQINSPLINLHAIGLKSTKAKILRSGTIILKKVPRGCRAWQLHVC